MKSHVCDFQRRDLAALAGFPLLTIGTFAILMHLGALLQLLPAPRPALDMDRTILLHQAEASRSRQSAELLLLGDSSCLMDVSAGRLGQVTASKTLNLGTLSYLDLPAFASMLRHFFAANPNEAKVVIVLLHPEFLRRVEAINLYVENLEKFYERADLCEPSSLYEQLSCFLGLEIVKGRILGRFMPVRLPREYANRYGFTTDLWRFLTDHDGSAVDPRKFVPQSGQGNAEYRLSKKLEADSSRFRLALPPRVKLAVGISPVPASFVGANYPKNYERMLADWSRCIQADVVLRELPSTLPDHWFASTTHLTEDGAQTYTDILARSVKVRISGLLAATRGTDRSAEFIPQ
jgi:hypothetical protein